MTWVKRLMKLMPITAIVQELVRFDMQAMDNPDIEGAEYSQGELKGYETREYLLEKWQRKCSYCGCKDVPLQIEHIQPKAKGGTNRISNLCLACEPCNKKKGTQDVAVFLKKKPEVLKSILAQAKRPLKDAAAVNATRWALFNALKDTDLPVATSTGGRTKWHRTRFGVAKAHWLDAACVGIMDSINVLIDTPLLVTCRGQGGRQKAALNAFGYPIRHNSLRPIHGWRTGDIAKLDGKLYAVTPRVTGSFGISRVGEKPTSKSMSKLTRVHKMDAYKYA
jgi:5-methylcytosine-specific restriction endonuclease McrA